MSSAFTRRSLLRSGALTTAAALVPGVAVAQSSPGKQSPVRLGLASYTFRNFDRAKLIGFMQELHVDALNAKDVKDHLPMDPAGEAAALAAYKAAGIRVHAAGAIYFREDNDADIRGKFEYCKRGNIPLIVAGDPPPSLLPKIEQFVKHYDIRFAIHNHGPEDKYWPSPLDVLKAVKNMDPRMGSCMDVGHAERAGTDVVKAVHTLGSRLLNVHMKDLTDLHDKESQVAVGEGKMPVPALFEALIETRYPGFVDLEYEVHADDPMPGVRSSFAYMRGVLAGMGFKHSERPS